MLGRLALALVMVLGVTLGPVISAAQESGDISMLFKVNDDDPVSSIPTPEERDKHPIEFAAYLQDVIARAERALEKGEYEKAAKYHEALARMVPDRAISFSRLCVDYGRLGRPELAAANCAKAIQLGGAKVIDHIRFINFSLQQQEFSPEDAKDVEASLIQLRDYAAKNPQPVPGSLPAKPTEAAAAAAASAAPKRERTKEEAIREFAERRQERMAKEAEKLKVTRPPLNPMHLPTEIEVLSCKLASRLRDAARLGHCIHALRAFKAAEAQLYPFEWARAIIQKDSRRADRLLEQGKKLGIPEATLAVMASEQEKAFASAPYVRWGLIGLASLAALAAGAVALRQLSKSKRRGSPPAAPVEA